MKLIEKEARGRFVFVGDTCGDMESSKRVFDKYLASDTTIVFLGNYISGLPKSRDNVDFLLNQRERNSESVYLLQGSRENYRLQKYCPSNFWDSLTEKESSEYSDIFEGLPMVFSAGGIVATYGALPDICQLADIERVEKLDDNWNAMLWGGFHECEAVLRHGGRGSFGFEYFDRVMSQIGKSVLVRGSQPNVKRSIFDDRCLTLFSPYVDSTEVAVAVVDFDKVDRVRSIDDLVVEII